MHQRYRQDRQADSTVRTVLQTVAQKLHNFTERNYYSVKLQKVSVLWNFHKAPVFTKFHIMEIPQRKLKLSGKVANFLTVQVEFSLHRKNISPV